MVTNRGDTEGLFHGVVMSAGSPLPTGDIEELQPAYDQIVDAVGCGGASDTLACLRQVPAANLTAAAGTLPNLFGYSGLATPWPPRADGTFLTAPPQQLVLAGQVADVPFITGDALDEGTLFATGSWNVTYVTPTPYTPRCSPSPSSICRTEQEFRDYVHDFFFPRTPPAALEPLFSLYPADPAAGSPFMTGDANQLAPMYKRMAAFQGDVIFQAPRRFFLDQRSSKQPAWSYSASFPFLHRICPRYRYMIRCDHFYLQSARRATRPGSASPTGATLSPRSPGEPSQSTSSGSPRRRTRTPRTPRATALRYTGRNTTLRSGGC